MNELKKGSYEKFVGICSASDVEREANTIMTFRNEIWSNLNDGRFILQRSLHTSKPKIACLSKLYGSIRTVNSNQQLIGKRSQPGQQLKRLKYPSTIQPLKRKSLVSS